jgi:hypothetical protein
MEFTCTVDVDLPIEKTIELWNNPDNFNHWQDGYESFEHISGAMGTPGAKSRIMYKMRGSSMELIETIQVTNLPEEFTALYEHKHMANTMSHHFESLGENQTRWTAKIHYIKFNAFLPRLLFKIFPNMAKKQTQKWFDQFKVFAESHTST